MAASDLTETIAQWFGENADCGLCYGGLIVPSGVEHYGAHEYVGCPDCYGAANSIAQHVIAALGLHEEARGRHVYYAYGREFEGHGPSMDPHRCGHPDETCRSWTERRYVTDWEVME